MITMEGVSVLTGTEKSSAGSMVGGSTTQQSHTYTDVTIMITRQTTTQDISLTHEYTNIIVMIICQAPVKPLKAVDFYPESANE